MMCFLNFKILVYHLTQNKEAAHRDQFVLLISIASDTGFSLDNGHFKVVCQFCKCFCSKKQMDFTGN
jgi:hypothetical protein